MSKRMNFPGRVKARREGALYRLKNVGEKFLPRNDQKAREAKQAKRAAEIMVLESRIAAG